VQIYGNIQGSKETFHFNSFSESKNLTSIGDIYTFPKSKILVYVDGIVTKFSDKAIQLTQGCKSPSKKIAYLHSLEFNIESHICGSFNIFLYDFENKSLKIIRDTKGTRSLFYAHYGKNFAFSSCQEAIINTIKEVSLNKHKLLDFLNWDYRSNDQTYFNEIKRAKPGNTLTYEKNILTSKKYDLVGDIFSFTNKEDSKEAFKNLLYIATTNMAKKNQKVGLMLSGGLDSSAIAIALKDNNYDDVRTYSANFRHVKDNNNIDEATYQKNITALTSFKHCSVQMEGKSTIVPIKNFTKVFNQPINFPNIYIFDEIIKKLKNDKIEIILDGNDGDNTVSHGFEVLFYYLKRLRLFKFIKEVYLYSRFKKASFLRLIYLFTKQAIKEILKIRTTKNNDSLLKKDIKISMNPKNMISFFSSHRKKLSIDLHYLGNEFRNDIFRHHDLENFSPFYDEDLINFCINMGNKNKLKDGHTRKILREFLSEYLTEDHVYRDKSNLAEGILKNFTDADLSFIKNEYININKTLCDFLDKGKVSRIIKNIENGEDIKEKELINLQMFVSVNTFLNNFKF